jgi:sucrose phosphorylase
MQNQVQLITYADRLAAGGLPELRELLRGPLSGLFGGVHILPFFFPIDGADAGFDPIDHTQVDPRLGTWNDIRALAADVDVMADLIVNHISTESPQFRDFVRNGAQSVHAGLFLTAGSVFPESVDEKSLKAIYRPRPGTPFTTVTLASGEQQTLWTTFTPQQVDIDVGNAHGRAYLTRILRAFADSGVKVIRLDAVGYAIKRAGTSCFMLPETLDFIADLTAEARAFHLEVLVEIHAHYERQIAIAARVDRVYDFALPPLVLHAIAAGAARFLKEWIRIRPANALNVLDTHDGIGVIDAGAEQAGGTGKPGLLPPAEISRLVESIHTKTSGESRQATGAAASNLDLYQVNSTYYDALGRNDRHYLLARAIQFFLPGIPQVYYMGLLAGTNDMELLARTGVGRDINRHYYQPGEVQAALGKPVVQDLCDLIRLRNQHPAFAGQFQLGASADDELQLDWIAGEHSASLRVQFREPAFQIIVSENGQPVYFQPRV